MSEHEKSTEIEKVPCEICLKEIPQSEAEIAEASDYVLYFCGLEWPPHNFPLAHLLTKAVRADAGDDTPPTPSALALALSSAFARRPDICNSTVNWPKST